MDALKLLREMEHKYARAIEAMRGENLAVRPPALVLRNLEENLERTRQNIRELEAVGPKRKKKRATK